MRDLLIAVRDALRASPVLNYVRGCDVYVTPYEGFIPHGAKFPALGVKDGDVVRKELAGGYLDETLRVTVCVYSQEHDPEEAVIGNTRRQGIVDIARDVNRVLDENLLGLDGMISAFCAREAASELFGDDRELLQRKLLTFEFIRERKRP
ncbi:MAG: hypothetical protein ACNI3A_18730 [Desulfovibrio sp.]|uniref:hypothetical protein n=1 Tax=Desulfovibrio sp. 7SRBS1 TaxID=3378064 RepID=UPI003B402A0B